jgi:hypothetical protein
LQLGEHFKFFALPPLHNGRNQHDQGQEEGQKRQAPQKTGCSFIVLGTGFGRGTAHLHHLTSSAMVFCLNTASIALSNKLAFVSCLLFKKRPLKFRTPSTVAGFRAKRFPPVESLSFPDVKPILQSKLNNRISSFLLTSNELHMRMIDFPLFTI